MALSRILATMVSYVQAGTGAVKRYLQDKLRESVSVMDYGAKGDGVAIDRATIQAAIDALNAVYVATGRESILTIPAGTYLVDAVDYRNDAGNLYGAMSLMMRDGVHIRGKGTIKVKSNAYGAGAFYRCFASRDGDANRLANASICDITIDGNSANQTASTQCSNIVLEAARNVTVSGVTSLNANGNGIMVRGSASQLAQGLVIERCTVSGATSIGIQSSQFYSLRITGNNVSGCTDNSIDIYGEDGTTTVHGLMFTIANNVINGGLVGIFCETVGHGTVTGNSLTACTAIGLVVNRINGQPRDIVFSGNQVRGCPVGARVTGDTGGILITSNIFDGYSNSGVDLGGAGGGNCSYVDVSGNFFTPSSNTVATIRTQGNVVSFCRGRGNTVNASGISEGLLLFRGAATNVSINMGGFTVTPDQVGPDSDVKLLRAAGVQLFTGGWSNAPGPFDTTIPDNTGGDIYVTCYQAALGFSRWRVPYVKRAGSLTVGAAEKTFSGTETLQSVLSVGGNARIYVQAGNSFVQYGVQYVSIY